MHKSTAKRLKNNTMTHRTTAKYTNQEQRHKKNCTEKQTLPQRQTKKLQRVHKFITKTHKSTIERHNCQKEKTMTQTNYYETLNYYRDPKQGQRHTKRLQETQN